MKSDHELAAHLCSFERSFLNSAVRRSRAVSDLLADDFVEFSSSGRTFDKTQTIILLEQSSPITITASDMRATRLADGVVLITYRARHDGQPSTHSLRSSIWQLRGGKWQ